MLARCARAKAPNRVDSDYTHFVLEEEIKISVGRTSSVHGTSHCDVNSKAQRLHWNIIQRTPNVPNHSLEQLATHQACPTFPKLCVATNMNCSMQHSHCRCFPFFCLRLALPSGAFWAWQKVLTMLRVFAASCVELHFCDLSSPLYRVQMQLSRWTQESNPEDSPDQRWFHLQTARINFKCPRAFDSLDALVFESK